MNTERWARIKTLFAQATELPPSDRPAFLERECAGDAALLAEVGSLLASHDPEGGFLESLPDRLRAAALCEHSRVGERIGPYRLVEIVGTGGMGDVYKAVRDDDLYRAAVAIKLMRADVRNPLAERRFRSERQILAALDHRNIARLLDGGTTDQGLPYVVMELVSGEPIDQYCDTRDLNTRDRVQLFLQVCSAVSYAHQHLVVHRDLKPSNVFVTADGSVKLLDFGIAKLLENDLVTGAPAEETRTQFRAMTLEYASPEQVSGGAVTTVSDVYSLGVVLYRLLTGQSPYRASGGDAARVAEILGDTAPTRPSAATQDRRVIGSDLDHILLMALRKEPAKRYGSVEQFAADLRNYLQGHAVSARRGTFGYRLGKFTRRHKVPIAAAVLVALSLASGLGLALREARIANAERAIAQRHFDSVRKLANRLFEFHDEIADLPGATKAREDLVKTSLEYLDALYKEAGSDPALREELGMAYRKVGTIQSFDLEANLGDSKAALQSFQRAAELLEPLVQQDPANDRVALSLAKTWFLETRVLMRTQGVAAAKSLGEKTIALLESRPSLAADFEYATTLGNAYFTLAEIVGNQGDVTAGFDLIDKMVAVAEQYQRAHPQERRANEMLQAVYSNAGTAVDSRLSRTDAVRRSVALFRKSLAIDEALLAESPGDQARRISIAETRFNLGNSLLSIAQFDEAQREYALADPVLTEAATDDKDARAGFVLAILKIGLARSLILSGRPAESLPHLSIADTHLERLMKNGADGVEFKFAKNGVDILHGGALLRLAEAPGIAESRRIEWLRKSRELSARGAAGAREVNEVYPLIETNKEVWDYGIANLAQAEAALAAAR